MKNTKETGRLHSLLHHGRGGIQTNPTPLSSSSPLLVSLVPRGGEEGWCTTSNTRKHHDIAPLSDTRAAKYRAERIFRRAQATTANYRPQLGTRDERRGEQRPLRGRERNWEEAAHAPPEAKTRTNELVRLNGGARAREREREREKEDRKVVGRGWDDTAGDHRRLSYALTVF